MKRISEWIFKYDTHDILDDTRARENFKEETGKQPPWDHCHTAEELKGIRYCDINARSDTKHISVLEIASACTDKYIPQPWHHGKYGMGFAVNACIDKLKQHGY